MNAADAKQAAKEWVKANVQWWPSPRAAHLVGGITVLPETVAFHRAHALRGLP